MSCSVCHKGKHTANAHTQRCAVCGGGATVKREIEDVNPGWHCDNDELHKRVASGFGDPTFIDQARGPRMKVPKAQMRLVE